MTQPLVAEHRGGSNRIRNDRSRNRRTHDTVPFIASCNHFTRKNTRFRAPASSPTQPPCNIHAAITMRFAASRSKPASLYTRMATPDDNNHAAIPMRSATTDSRNAKNYAHRHNHSLQNAEEKPIASGTTAATTAAHNRTHRYLSSPAAATLHGKTQGFVLRLPPQHNPHATFMQPLQCASHHPVANLHLSTLHAWQHQMTTIMQPFNAICRKRIELRTQTQPLVAEHKGESNRVPNDRSRDSCNRRTHEVPFNHRRLQPLHTEKHKVSCSGFLPNTTPMQHSRSHYNAFRSIP